MMRNLLWYQQLNKPILTPPDWIFTPVWVILYILMAVSLFLYITSPAARNRILPPVMFFIQLVLTFLWPFIFFETKSIQLAAVISISLVIIVLILMQLFYKVSKASALILVPYFLWLCFATYLGIELIRLNP